MTTRANRANLSPKGTQHAPAKPAPKGAKPAQKTPSKVPAKASKPVAPSATKAPTASQPAKVTAASVTAKLEAAQPSGPLGLTPGDIREAQRDPRNAIPPQAPRKAQRGLHIPSEADAPTQEELRAALARENQVPATGPYALDAAQVAAAQIAAAQNAHTPLIAVKRMSAEERRYAKNRIEAVIHAKNGAFKRERDELNRWGMVRDLFTKALASGRFSVDVNKLARANTETNVIDVVKLDDYPQGLGKHVQSLYDALDARQERMKAAGARLLDEIMLGSPADAIERIQHFENTKF